MELSKLNFLTFMMMWMLSGEITVIPSTGPSISETDTFTFPAEVRDFCPVVINELVADPTPVVGLPDAEWIEIYNCGNCILSLKNWIIKVGTTQKALPDSSLSPQEYAIICSSRFASEFRKYGRTIVLNTLPALRNSGNRIVLCNASDSIVDEIDYSDSWYGSSGKKNGGWSLERIDPLRNCGQSANWSASVHPEGGTPGKTNSVFAVNTDHEAPQILSVSTYSIQDAEFCFSETMDTFRLKDRLNYRLSDGYGNPEIIHIKDERTVLLHWEKSFAANSVYLLSFENLTDPCGNVLREKQIEIGWITIDQKDMVINEVLFNPRPGCTDFVEIFNNSAKHIEAGRLLLATRDQSGQLKSHVSLKNAQTIVRPGAYLALTTDTTAIHAFYTVFFPDCVRQLPSLPALYNDRGTIVLLNDSMEILDEFTYSEEMHHPLLFDREGVSLERINPKAPTQSDENWQSASSETGYATPGYRNSQYQEKPLKHTTVTFGQEAISPNDDGYNDELLIRYETRKPGWTVSCTVFDSSGRLICTLLKNAIAGTSGDITWNGKDRFGAKLPSGPYVVLTEFFSLEGYSEWYKNAVVLTVKGK
jgi:hypothetical protein